MPKMTTSDRYLVKFISLLNNKYIQPKNERKKLNNIRFCSIPDKYRISLFID